MAPPVCLTTAAAARRLRRTASLARSSAASASLGGALRADFPVLHQEVSGRRASLLLLDVWLIASTRPLVYLDSAATSQKPRQARAASLVLLASELPLPPGTRRAGLLLRARQRERAPRRAHARLAGHRRLRGRARQGAPSCGAVSCLLTPLSRWPRSSTRAQPPRSSSPAARRRPST